MRTYVVHPYIDNQTRNEVNQWCQHHLDDSHFVITSNYKSSDRGTFDIHFYDRSSAMMFMLRWGGEIVEVIDRTDDGRYVNFHALFDEETI